MSCPRPAARLPDETASSRSGRNCAGSGHGRSGVLGPRRTALGRQWRRQTTAINRVLEAQVAALTQARKAEAAELGRILSDLMAAEAVREEEARNA
jgi:hypothetical protein